MKAPSEDEDMKAIRDLALAAAYNNAAREEPPARLDHKIRAAARRGVHPAGRGTFWIGWRMPAATVAVALLAVSVAAMLHDEPASPTHVALLAQPSRSSQDQPQPRVPRVTAVPAPVVAFAPVEQAGNTRAANTRLAMAERGVNEPQPVPPPLVVLAPAPEPAPRAANEASDRGQAGVFAASPAAALAYAPAQTGNIAETLKAERLDETTSADGLARVPLTVGSARILKKESDISPPDTAKAARVVPQPTATDNAAPAMAALLPEAPEAWLGRILTLRRQGQIEAAKKSFAGFRSRYPNYPLPQSLKPWAAHDASNSSTEFPAP